MPPRRIAALRAAKRIKARGAPRRAESKEHADLRREIERLRLTLVERNKVAINFTKLFVMFAKAMNEDETDIVCDMANLADDILLTADADGNVPVASSDMVEKYLSDGQESD